PLWLYNIFPGFNDGCSGSKEIPYRGEEESRKVLYFYSFSQGIGGLKRVRFLLRGGESHR
ncbi:MAG TPA: hypothetical protein DCP08_04275, partial [Chloroflexi bacterium]|nr:hypothetical protein [Chloroflexota bacterium]